jgi:hypothetical protein
MGGGHNDTTDNSMYRFDVATLSHSQIKTNVTAYVAGDGYVADSVTGWMWDNTGSYVAPNYQVGQPFIAHFYGGPVCLPSSALAGSAGNGWIVTPGRTAMPNVGSRGTNQAHILSLGSALPSGISWSMIGSPLQAGVGYGCSCYDSSRNRVVVFPAGANFRYLPYIDIASQTVDTLDTGATNTDLFYYSAGYYSPSNDLYLIGTITGNAGGITLRVVTPTGQIFNPTLQGTPPPALSGGGWDWVESMNAMVFYRGLGENTVYFLSPNTSNLATGAWTWSSKTLTGVTPLAHVGSAPHYNKFRYVPGARCFLWFSQTNQSVQAFNVTFP